jgi:hypothetical protein
MLNNLLSKPPFNKDTTGGTRSTLSDCPIIIESNGLIAYRKSDLATDLLNSETCSICWDNIAKVEQKQLPCGHLFHQACMGKALSYSMRCPSCRQNPLTANAHKLAPSTKVYLPIIIGAGDDLRILGTPATDNDKRT